MTVSCLVKNTFRERSVLCRSESTESWRSFKCSWRVSSRFRHTWDQNKSGKKQKKIADSARWKAPRSLNYGLLQGNFPSIQLMARFKLSLIVTFNWEVSSKFVVSWITCSATSRDNQTSEDCARIDSHLGRWFEVNKLIALKRMQ